MSPLTYVRLLAAAAALALSFASKDASAGIFVGNPVGRPGGTRVLVFGAGAP